MTLPAGPAPGWGSRSPGIIATSDSTAFWHRQDNGYQFAIYGRVDADALYLTAAGAYSIFDSRTVRTISSTAVSGSYRADFTAHRIGGRMEAGLSDGLAVLRATPFAALVVDSISMPQYGEATVSGSTVMALQSMETSFDRLRSELGLGWNNIAAGDGSGVIWNGRWLGARVQQRRQDTARLPGVPEPGFHNHGRPAEGCRLHFGGLDGAACAGSCAQRQYRRRFRLNRQLWRAPAVALCHVTRR